MYSELYQNREKRSYQKGRCTLQSLRWLIVVSLLCLPVYAKRLHPEAFYQNEWCKANNGVVEYELEDFTRVDCLTDSQAVEFDFANKWAECIGQSLYYGLMTDKEPVCALIMENPTVDERYLKRIQEVAQKTGLTVITLSPDI